MRNNFFPDHFGPSFDGSEGTYQVGFDDDNRVLVVKIAPNPVLSDPHTINSYYAKAYGLVTADDSARHQAFKASAKSISDKWYTFRYHLAWAGKPAEDGAMPWLDYAEFLEDGRVFPLLIINLSSISPIEERAKKMSGKLVKKAFTSPTKVKGVNMSSPTAQAASLLEQMFKAGFKTSMMTDEMKQAARKFGIDPEQNTSMELDDDTLGDTNKRTKTA